MVAEGTSSVASAVDWEASEGVAAYNAHLFEPECLRIGVRLISCRFSNLRRRDTAGGEV